METLSIPSNIKNEKVQPNRHCNQFFLNGTRYNVIKSSEVSKILKDLTECIAKDKEIQACQKVYFEENLKKQSKIETSSTLSSQPTLDICKSDSSSSELSVLTFPSVMETSKLDDNASKKFTCETCGKIFNKRDFLQKHKIVHEAPKHRCVLCDKCFMREDKLKRHFLSIHSKYRPHVCQICSKAFARKDKLKDHQKHHITAGDNFKCMECEISFVQKSDLNRHSRLIHAGKPLDDKKSGTKSSKTNIPVISSPSVESESMRNLSGVISAVMENSIKMKPPTSSIDFKSNFIKQEATIATPKKRNTNRQKSSNKNSNKTESINNNGKSNPMNLINSSINQTPLFSTTTTFLNFPNSSLTTSSALSLTSNPSTSITSNHKMSDIYNNSQATINSTNVSNFPFTSCFPYGTSNINSSTNTNKSVVSTIPTNLFTDIKPSPQKLDNISINNNVGSLNQQKSTLSNLTVESLNKDIPSDIKKECFDSQFQPSLNTSPSIQVAARAAAAAAFINNSPFNTFHVSPHYSAAAATALALQQQNTTSPSTTTQLTQNISNTTHQQHNIQDHPLYNNSSSITYPYTPHQTTQYNVQQIHLQQQQHNHILQTQQQQQQQYLTAAARSMMFPSAPSSSTASPTAQLHKTSPYNNLTSPHGLQINPNLFYQQHVQQTHLQQQQQSSSTSTAVVPTASSFQQPLMSALNCSFGQSNFPNYNCLLSPTTSSTSLSSTLNNKSNNTTVNNDNNNATNNALNSNNDILSSNNNNYPYIPF